MRSICGSPNCEQPDPPSQICANPAGEEAQSSGARSKFGAVPSSNFPCILSFMHLHRPWLAGEVANRVFEAGWVDSADRGGWQSVKRNIPRPKKLAAHFLQLNASPVAISLQGLSADPHRERSCAATFDLRRRLDQIATKSKLRSK